MIRLNTGIEIGVAPRDLEGLEHESAEAMAQIELEPFGLGIHFPAIDADIYIPALREGGLGSKRWMAARSAGLKARSAGG
jgi:hypothetical protein